MMRVLLIPLMMVIDLFPVPAPGLDYVDVSPSGAEFPEWEGGDTVLRFADIDADGHADLLSIGDHGSPFVNTNQHGIMVLFGDGALGWSVHMEGNFGYGGIAVGDVNNDGFLDAGYGMHHDYSGNDLGDQLIEVALGDGTGTSWTPWDDGLATNGEDWGMFATDFADIDGDGDLDLASNSFGCCNGVHVYRNDGDGTWTQTWASAGGNAGPFLTFGDVNGDGRPDLAATHQQGIVWLGDGEGGFAPANTGLPPQGSVGHGGVSLGDIDLDGCADISFCDDGGVFVYVWRADHWEDASNELPFSGSNDITYLHDMNVDGFVDVVAMSDGDITVWLGDGTGHWSDGGGWAASGGVSSQALEAGGDIDHNGFPDIALLREEGSWPSYHNELYVLRETSVPAERFAALQFPRGNEVLLTGSVQTIRWNAAHIGELPATIDLDVSTSGAGGPWQALATGVPDGGHRQWTVPATPTDEAHLRVTLRQGEESASAVSRAFRIVASDPAAAPAPSPIVLTKLTVSPNPAAAGARIRWETGHRGPAVMSLHDVRGRLVRRFGLGPSTTTIRWDGNGDDGRPLPAGVYFLGLRDASGRPLGMERRVTLIR